MSAIFASLSTRTVETVPSSEARTTAVTLDSLPRDAPAVVVGFDDTTEAGLARRLFDLGFRPGAEVRMLRRAPLGDPAIYRVTDYDLALRGAHSRAVLVERI